MKTLKKFFLKTRNSSKKCFCAFHWKIFLKFKDFSQTKNDFLEETFLNKTVLFMIRTGSYVEIATLHQEKFCCRKNESLLFLQRERFSSQITFVQVDTS